MRQVLLFDSGVGGWSVAQKLLRDYPRVNLTYLADNDGFPYGSRDPQVLAKRLEIYLRRLADDLGPDLIVCGCNTVSTTVLTQLQQNLGLRIVGILPALEQAALLSRKRIIGLLATPGTIASDYVEAQVRCHPEVQVRRLGCARLATLAEHKLAGRLINLKELRDCIAPLLNPSKDVPAPDVIVLGCSHFPLLLTELRLVAGTKVQWLDPADELLHQVAQIGCGTSMGAAAELAPQHRLVLTGPQRAASLQRIFHDWGFSRFETLASVTLDASPAVFLPAECRLAAAAGWSSARSGSASPGFSERSR